MKETQRIEWKESWRDESLKSICAFANAEGGVLVIGRNDKGVAVGVQDARKRLQDISNKVRGVYKGEYNYRSGSTNQALKGAALDRFLMRKVGRHWDGVPVPHVAIKDLSRAAIGTFRKHERVSRRLDAAILRESTPGLLDKLGATGRSPLRNHGELRHNWTLARLKGKHPSEPFNPDIANAFYQAGLSEPEFRLTDGFVASIPRKREEDRATVSGVTSPRTGEVTGEVKRLLLVLRGEMKRIDLQRLLRLRHEESFRRTYLTPAINTGLVEMTIPDKPNSRLQKYRLTAKGHAMLSSLRKKKTAG